MGKIYKKAGHGSFGNILYVDKAITNKFKRNVLRLGMSRSVLGLVETLHKIIVMIRFSSQSVNLLLVAQVWHLLKRAR